MTHKQMSEYFSNSEYTNLYSCSDDKVFALYEHACCHSTLNKLDRGNILHWNNQKMFIHNFIEYASLVGAISFFEGVADRYGWDKAEEETGKLYGEDMLREVTLILVKSVSIPIMDSEMDIAQKYLAIEKALTFIPTDENDLVKDLNILKEEFKNYLDEIKEEVPEE